MDNKNIISRMSLVIALLFYISGVSAEVLKKGELPAFTTTEQMATLYFYRPWTFVGGGGDFDILLNDEFIGNADNGSVVFARAKAGTFDLWMKLTEGVKTIFHKELVMHEGKIYFVFMDMSGSELVTLVDQETGKKAILDILKTKNKTTSTN